MNRYRVDLTFSAAGGATRAATWIIEAADPHAAEIEAAVRFGQRGGSRKLISVKATEAPSGPERVIDRTRLGEIANELGVRYDWHEPDEQYVTAEVRGKSFDNAGFWGEEVSAGKEHEELHVVLSKNGQHRFTVNLATLFAWATEDKR